MSGDSNIIKALKSENARLRRRLIELESQRLNIQHIESVLRERECVFRNLVEIVPASIHVLQGNHFCYINSNFSVMTGYSLKECVDMNFWDLVHPDYQDVIKERAWARQRGEEVTPVPEFKIISKSGRELWVDHTASNTTWDSKPAVTAVLHDLTERKRNEEMALHQHNLLQETYAELEEIYAELQSSQTSLLEINARLRESEKRLELALWAADEDLWDWNLETEYLYLSDRAVSRMGLRADELKPHLSSWISRVHPDDIAAVKAIFMRHYKKISDYFEAEYRLKSSTGEWIWILDRGKIVKRNKAGKALRMIGTKRYINKEKEIQAALQKSEARYRTLVETIPEIIAHSDSQSNFIWVNESGKAFFGEDVCQHNFRDYFINDEDYRQAFRTLASPSQNNEIVQLETKLKRHDGQIRILKWQSKLLQKSGEFVGALSTARDVTAKKEADARIKYLSYNDSLTGLYNRAFFDDQLLCLNVPEQLPLSIIVGDVNGLKLVNDTFGHKSGDKLLKNIAAIIQKSCRPDDIVVRWGGDEFVILLPRTSSKIAYYICEQIRTSCQRSKPDPIQASIALGTASKVSLTADINKVFSEAENMMYRNKIIDNKIIRSSIISSLETSLHEKAMETVGHAQRMQKLCIQFGQVLDLPANELERLALLARLHDIGKIGIADEILSKPGALSNVEWSEIKKHTEIGYRIAYSSHELAAIAEEILSHHERWDGNGYPEGLLSRNIPLLARIITIVDAYDVMTHVCSYKEALDHGQALAEISRCSASQFDPELVQVFLGIFA